MKSKANFLTTIPKSFVLFLLILLLILSACQAAPSPEITLSATLIPTKQLPTSTPTSLPSSTPTQAPLKISIDQVLPAELQAAFNLPPGTIFSESKKDADISVEPVSNIFKYAYQDNWVFALAAPFFTVEDDISLSDLREQLTSSSVDNESQFPPIKVRAEDVNLIQYLLKIKNPIPAFYILDELPSNPLEEASPEYWMILPFEKLSPEWKVLSIDGKSPLDDNYDPRAYALNLAYGVRVVNQNADPDPEILESLALQSSYQADQLSSLIMTGVTAMARDTAYEMEMEGILYPGTFIRDTMRAADLTHISNEVSFFEDCRFPNPDYLGFLFCSNPDYIDLLIDLGADIIELTGNHNNDVRALYKVDSVPFTLDLYEQNDMQWYAGGTDLSSAQAALKIEHNGNKLAFVGCNSYGPEMAWATEEDSGAAPCQDFTWMKETISALKQEGYLPIVTLQYQEDYFLNATKSAIEDFRPLAEAGAVIVNGSQSHVGKAIEFYSDGFIHYGLGNLFFDQPEYYITYDSFIQKHFFYQGRHISTQLLTITLEDTAKPRFMTPEERAKFLQDIFSVSQDLRSTP